MNERISTAEIFKLLGEKPSADTPEQGAIRQLLGDLSGTEDGTEYEQDRDAEYEKMLDLLAGALPQVVKMIRSKNPRLRVPVSPDQFRELMRMVWEHGYGYGIAREITDQGKGLR